MSDADPEVRQRAIAVLNGHGAHRAANRVLVIKLLDKDPDETVRVRAAIYCSRLGWPDAVVPLLNATDDPSIQVRGSVNNGLHNLRRDEFVLDDEISVSKTLLEHLVGPASSARYQSARLLWAATPGWYSLRTDSPKRKQLLSIWGNHQGELQRGMETVDANHQRAIDHLRREIATLKSEYQYDGFELGETFPLLGDDANQLVPAVIAHAKYEGSWALPGSYGRQHLRQLGPVAVPFIVKELANAELPDEDKALRRGAIPKSCRFHTAKYDELRSTNDGFNYSNRYQSFLREPTCEVDRNAISRSLAPWISWRKLPSTFPTRENI